MKMRRRRILSFIPLLLFGFQWVLGPSVYGQSGISNARSVAMGGAFTALARGVEAPRWNPANLALNNGKVYRLNLVSVGFGFHNNSFDKSQYDLYNGKFLTTEDKQAILASIPADGLRFDFDTEVQVMGISFGHFAVTASGLAASDFSISKDAVDLLLNGNEIDRLYDVASTRGEGWGLSSIAVSLAFPISVPLFQKFAVGGSFKYLRGFGYGKVIEAQSDVVTNIDGVHGSGRVVIDHARGGTGIGVDLGAAAALNREWSVSFAVRNFLNYINWNDETQRFTYTFRADSITAERAQKSDFDSLFVDSNETVDIEPFTTTVPAQLAIGVARVTRHFVFAADWVQGIRETAGASTTPQISLGSEMRLLPVLPLRVGVSFGGKHGVSSSAGFGLDFSLFSWDFAVSSRGGLFSGRGLGAAFDWMFRL